jgi:TonB family protein
LKTQANSFLFTKICFAFVLMTACVFNAQGQTPTPTPTPTPQPLPTSNDSTPPQKTTPDQKPSGCGLKILSDTQGVDFRPYITRLKNIVQNHWDPLIPAVAMPPTSKSGTTIFELEVGKNGNVSNMKLKQSSDDASLDEAARGALVTAEPFPALPAEFSGEYLRLRACFYYNPPKGNNPLKADSDAK